MTIDVKSTETATGCFEECSLETYRLNKVEERVNNVVGQN